MAIIWINKEKLFATVKKTLTPVKTVLDIGCGIRPQDLQTPDTHICVDPFPQYIKELQNKIKNNNNDTLSIFIQADWAEILKLLPSKSVDNVYLLDVIEHLDKEEGRKLLQASDRIARNQIIIFTPLGFVPQNPVGKDAWGLDGVSLQTHQSGWEFSDFDRSWEIFVSKNFHQIGKKYYDAFFAIKKIKKESVSYSLNNILCTLKKGLKSDLGQLLQILKLIDMVYPTEKSITLKVLIVILRWWSKILRWQNKFLLWRLNRVKKYKNKKMKFLIVAMSESVHTVSWVEQINGQGWEIHLFPSIHTRAATQQFPSNIIVHRPYFIQNMKKYTSLRELSLINRWIYKIVRYFKKPLAMFLDYFVIDRRTDRLVKLIKKIKPDIIHSMEFQNAGYLVLEAKKRFRGEFPTWLATIWGSDIYLFGRLDKHKAKVQEVLNECDYFSCECLRDICLAIKQGFKGKVFPPSPVTAGFDLKKIVRWRKTQTSKRKIIMLKGYQGIFGRNLIGLRALERCKDLLKGYKIFIYLMEPGSPMEMAAELFNKSTGVEIEFIPLRTPKDEIMKLHGRARISIGLGVSDGISVSFLEAMVMGSFPIQSNSSCSNEWASPNKGAFYVPPEDSDVVAKAIRKALTNDKLVDNAARLNWQTAIEKLDYTKLKQKAINLYEKIYYETRKS